MSFGSHSLVFRALGGLALSALLSAPAIAGEVRYADEGHAENPAWSRDGKYVAFEVNKFAGDVGMYFAEVTGDIAKDAVRVKLPGGGSSFGGSGQVVMNATWHQDGIAVFEGSNAGGQLRLYFAAPGGSVAQEMLSSSKAPGGLTFPIISPDGNRLAFVSDETGNGDIRTWDRSTDKLSQLTNTTGSESFPSYGSNGTDLLFTRKVNNSLTIYEVDTTSGRETQIATGTGDQTRPVYAADGHIVFFSAKAQDKWDIVTVDADGSNPRTLAEGVRFPIRSRPALSPDGQWVAFGYDDPTKANKIVLKKVDGSRTVEIPTDFVACGEPSLGLQNGRVLLAYTALPSTDSDWRFLYVMDITDRL